MASTDDGKDGTLDEVLPIADESNDYALDDVLLIAVMGVTGSGKSNFLKHLTDEAGFDGAGPIVGKSLESCTQRTETFNVSFRGHRFVFFDTPGFDDTHRGDSDILIDIAETLSISYKNKLKLSGIIYLHRIKDERVSNGIQRNFDMFRYLCGDNFFGNVLLVTTFWDELKDVAIGEERERELLKKPDWWGEMKSKGSQIRRFDNTRQSAIDLLLEVSHLPPVVLQVQKEMVEEGLDVAKTTAGVALNHELATLRAKFEEEIRLLRERQEQARLEQNKALQMALEKKEAENQAFVMELMAEQAALRAENREGRRRQEQEFTDQIMRMERANKSLLEKLKTQEEQVQSEQDAAKQRMDEVMERFNTVQAQMDEAKAGKDKIAELEREKRDIQQKALEWQAEMKRLAAERQKLQEEQMQSSAEETSRLNARLLELENQRKSTTSSFWMSLSGLAALGELFLKIFSFDS